MKISTPLRHSLSTLIAILMLGAIWSSAASASAQEAPDGVPGAGGVSGALAAGSGEVTLPEATIPEEYIGDKVRVSVAAHGQPDLSADGHFRVVHRTPAGALVADIRGYLDCLRFEGDYAVMTGIVTDADTTPDAVEEVHAGMAAAIVIQDNGGGNRDNMIWRFAAVETTCTEIPALAPLSVESGNFVVRD